MHQQLKQAIESAYVEVTAHPEHVLMPIHRHAIYDALSLSDPLHERQVFKRLAIVTARHALPVWQRTQPDDKAPSRLIEMAEGVTNGTVLATVAEAEASEAWKRIESLGNINDDVSVSKASFYAYVAAFEALMEVLGRDPFSDIIIDERDTDSDLDPWCSDTALWVAAAYSEQVGDQEADVLKRQEFWTWWLQEAIPTAWELAHQ